MHPPAPQVTPGVPGVKPCRVKMIDAVTKEHVETIEPDAVMVCTGRAPFSEGLGLADAGVKVERGFVQVNEKMQALGEDGNPIDGLWCIGDLNGKMMLAHAASAQGISAVENMCGDEHVVNHDAVPAACFTHPEISFCGMTQEQAEAKGEEEGFPVAVAKTSFKANSKALAELDTDGLAKLVYNPKSGEILGVHIIGIHAADLIQEAANAIAKGNTVHDLKFCVHTHPTLSEVVDELFKGAKLEAHEPIAA